jgi:hypothetical protein
MANVPVTRIPGTTFFGHVANGASLVLVLLAVPVALIVIGAPLALLIKGALMLFERLF